MKKNHLISTLLFLTLGAVPPLIADAQGLASETNPLPEIKNELAPEVVIELFTSQGCSSCPPANKFAAKLAKDPEKLVLTYGVTYWDYLGWKDTFGQAEFTERQRAYGQVLEIGNVYTPQMVLNGSAHSPRYSRKDVETMLLHSDRPETQLSIDATGLMVSLPTSLKPEEVRIALIAYTPGDQDVDVSKGENRGRTLQVANVVESVKTFAPKTNWPLLTGIKPQDGFAYASLVHDAKTGKIISAARYRP